MPKSGFFRTRSVKRLAEKVIHATILNFRRRGLTSIRCFVLAFERKKNLKINIFLVVFLWNFPNCSHDLWDVRIWTSNASANLQGALKRSQGFHRRFLRSAARRKPDFLNWSLIAIRKGIGSPEKWQAYLSSAQCAAACALSAGSSPWIFFEFLSEFCVSIKSAIQIMALSNSSHTDQPGIWFFEQSNSLSCSVASSSELCRIYRRSVLPASRALGIWEWKI